MNDTKTDPPIVPSVDPYERPHLTVATVLAAHAAAQIAAARCADEASHAADEAGVTVVEEEEVVSFTATWACEARGIGWPPRRR